MWPGANYFRRVTVPLGMDNMRKLASAGATLALVAALATACDEDPPETVQITSPTEGEVVSLPFEATFEASVPLGSPDAGLHHLHVWFGNDVDAYQVVEGNVATITLAPDGSQEMHVSLRNADHSDAGVETSMPIVISGGTT
jgi:hypothetical protein